MKENKASAKHNTGSAKLVLLLTEAEPSFCVSHGNTSTTSLPIRNQLASFNLKQSQIKLVTSCTVPRREWATDEPTAVEGKWAPTYPTTSWPSVFSGVDGGRGRITLVLNELDLFNPSGRCWQLEERCWGSPLIIWQVLGLHTDMMYPRRNLKSHWLSDVLLNNAENPGLYWLALWTVENRWMICFQF